MISYAPFRETMKQKGMTRYRLEKDHHVSPNTFTRMNQNKYLSLRTIEDFCRILDCRIEDIVEYIPDET